MDNYNYPLGADTKDAPWNQEELPELKFNVCISQTLSKTTTVMTNDYIDGGVSEDADHDSEGNWFTYYTQDPPDTSETNWRQAYTDEHLTPLQLIAELKKLKEREAKTITELLSTAVDELSVRKYKRQLSSVTYSINECDGWVEDECEIIED